MTPMGSSFPFPAASPSDVMFITTDGSVSVRINKIASMTMTYLGPTDPRPMEIKLSTCDKVHASLVPRGVRGQFMFSVESAGRETHIVRCYNMVCITPPTSKVSLSWIPVVLEFLEDVSA